MSAQADRHKNQLDGLRCYAVLLVFFFHAYPWEVFSVGHGVPYSYFGHLGVQVFFALSGFLICRILLVHESGDLKSDLKTFYIRRVLRIVPLYYTFLTVNLLCGNLPDPSAYYLFTFNFQFFLAQRGPHGECWSLCVEEQFYLLFPLILLTTSKQWRLRCLVILLVFMNLFQFWFDNSFSEFSERSLYLLPNCAHYLLCGAIAAHLDLKSKAEKLFRHHNEAFFLLGLLMLVPWFYAIAYRFDYNFTFYHSSILLLHAVALSMMVFGLWRTGNKFLLLPFKLPPVVYIGRISFAFYLLHNTALLAAYFLFDKYLPSVRDWALVAAFCFAVLFSTISWYGLERPFNGLKRRFPYF